MKEHLLHTVTINPEKDPRLTNGRGLYTVWLEAQPAAEQVLAITNDGCSLPFLPPVRERVASCLFIPELVRGETAGFTLKYINSAAFSKKKPSS